MLTFTAVGRSATSAHVAPSCMAAQLNAGIACLLSIFAHMQQPDIDGTAAREVFHLGTETLQGVLRGPVNVRALCISALVKLLQGIAAVQDPASGASYQTLCGATVCFQALVG
eukprot:SAG11_NODE_2543_length_3237_cov_2.170172_1_plen_113_part_00